MIEEVEKETKRKLLEAKIEDQYHFAIYKNKITHTDFLNHAEKNIAEKFLKEKNIRNYQFFGGNGENSDRNILLFYPEKFSLQILEKNYDNILCAIRINLPKDLKYEHRIFLSGIMKLGIKREKIGDILIREDGADIIILNEVSNFLIDNLQNLTRFKKATCDLIHINEVEHMEKKFEDMTIIVSSMRLDNFVSELAKCSRTKAVEIINAQKVFLNYILETKYSKKINKEDVINIRGKGKFIVGEIDHKTRSDKYMIHIKKFV